MKPVLLLISAALLVAAIATGPARAALPGPPVSLDPAFGEGGVVTTDHRLAWPVLKQTEGRLYVAGEGSVFRFGPDGAADVSFGVDGEGEAASLANGTRLSADLLATRRGEVFTISTTTSRRGPAAGYGMEVNNLDPDGALDLTFGRGGLIGSAPGSARLYPDRSTLTGTALDLAWEDRLLIAGGTSVERPRGAIASLTLLNRNGSIARFFGVRGSFRLGSARPGSAEFTDVMVMPGGRALVAGVFGKRVAVVELDRSGRLVPSFGRGGFAVFGTTSGPGPPFVAASGPGAELAVGSSGQIYVLHGASGLNRVTALREDGLRLRYFGNNGTVGFRPGARGLDWKDILPLSGGRVLLAGSQYRADDGLLTRQSALLLMGADGRRDQGFGVNGLWRDASPPTGAFSDVAVAPRRTLVAAGTTGRSGGRGDLTLTRFLTIPVAP
jgi:hypothetical protein